MPLARRLLAAVGQALSADCVSLLHVGRSGSAARVLLAHPVDDESTLQDLESDWTGERIPSDRVTWAASNANGSGCSVLRSIAWREGPASVVIELRRSPGADPFDHADARTLSQLSPGIGMALRSAFEAAPPGMFEEIFHGLPFGLAFVDGARRVIAQNAAMRRILARADGLMVLDRQFRAARDEDDLELARAFQDLVEGDRAASEILLVSRSPGGAAPRYYCLIQRARGAFPGHSHPCRLAVVDSVDVEFDNLAQVARRFRLTMAEARIMQVLLTGMELKDCADQARVSLHTLRWHVKRIMAKTGTSSRTALTLLFVRALLLFRSPAIASDAQTVQGGEPD